MTHLAKKVLWSEGILLSQQHFQQFERSIEERLSALTQLCFYAPWGVLSMAIDHRKLHQGFFSVSAISVLMPNGTWAMYDGKKEVLNELAFSEDKHDVYFNLPDNYQVTKLNGYPNYQSSDCAWQATYETTKDDLDANREKEVIFIKPNARLDFQPLKQISQSIKLAQIVKVKGRYQIEPCYIPPILTICVSTQYQDKLRMIQEVLQQVFDVLYQNDFNLSIKNCDVVKSIVLRMMTFITIESNKGSTHPEIVFDALYQGLLELQTLIASVKHTPIIYRHRDIYQCLDTIHQKLSDISFFLMHQQGTTLTLKKSKAGVFYLDSIDESLFAKDWYIALKGGKKLKILQEIDKTLLKVSSKHTIDKLIQGALPGLNLLTSSIGRLTYQLDKRSPLWQQILEEQSIAVFIATDLVCDITLVIQ